MDNNEIIAEEIKPVAKKPYYAGIDIVKLIAVFFVVCVHFCLYNGFYYTPLNEKSALLPIAYRWLVYTCVPLFMISTGYLMKNKKLSRDYYKGLIKIIIIYAVIGVICLTYQHWRYGTEYKAWDILKSYLQFNAANYGWYVNYYISLFLIIPFLNLAFNGLENKKQRALLVVTVFMITSLGKSLFLGFERDNQIRLLPDYISGMWPVAYYFVGAYLREHPIKRNIRNKLIVFVLLCGMIVFQTYSTYKHTAINYSDDNHFTSWHFNDYGSYPVFITATLIFMLFYDITTTNTAVKRIMRIISGATFGTYLISYVFDNMFYATFTTKGGKLMTGFNEIHTELSDKFLHWYEIVPKIFILSLACGIMIHTIYDFCEGKIKKMTAKKTIKEENAENVTISA